MAKFVFKIYWTNDDENVWVSARDKVEAIFELRSEYPNIKDFLLLEIIDG
jgi:hypothetical protein